MSVVPPIVVDVDHDSPSEVWTAARPSREALWWDILVHIRGTCAFNWLPERLYQSHRYNFQVEIRLDPAKYPPLPQMLILQLTCIHVDDHGKEVDGETDEVDNPILDNVGLTGLRTLDPAVGCGKTYHTCDEADVAVDENGWVIYQAGDMMIRVNRSCYGLQKPFFRLKLTGYRSKIEDPLFVILSRPFMPFARKNDRVKLTFRELSLARVLPRGCNIEPLRMEHPTASRRPTSRAKGKLKKTKTIVGASTASQQQQSAQQQQPASLPFVAGPPISSSRSQRRRRRNQQRRRRRRRRRYRDDDSDEDDDDSDSDYEDSLTTTTTTSVPTSSAARKTIPIPVARKTLRRAAKKTYIAPPPPPPPPPTQQQSHHQQPQQQPRRRRSTKGRVRSARSKKGSRWDDIDTEYVPPGEEDGAGAASASQQQQGRQRQRRRGSSASSSVVVIDEESEDEDDSHGVATAAAKTVSSSSSSTPTPQHQQQQQQEAGTGRTSTNTILGKRSRAEFNQLRLQPGGGGGGSAPTVAVAPSGVVAPAAPDPQLADVMDEGKPPFKRQRLELPDDILKMMDPHSMSLEDAKALQGISDHVDGLGDPQQAVEIVQAARQMREGANARPLQLGDGRVLDGDTLMALMGLYEFVPRPGDGGGGEPRSLEPPASAFSAHRVLERVCSSDLFTLTIQIATHAKHIAEESGMVYLSLPEMIQYFVDRDTRLGERVTKYRAEHPEEGLSQDLIYTCIQARLNEEDCVVHGWVMDSYPRVVDEVEHLRQIYCLPLQVVWLQLNTADLRGRFADSDVPVEKVKRFRQNYPLLTEIFERYEVLAVSVSASDSFEVVADNIDAQLAMLAEGMEEDEYSDGDDSEEEEEEGESDDDSEDESRPYALLRRVPIRTTGDRMVDFILSDRYVNAEFVGGGAYGVVIKAHDTVLKADVAIKLIRGLMTQFKGPARITYLTRVIREILVLRHVRKNCPFVTALLDLIPTCTRAEEMDEVVFVMPWGGENFWHMLHSFTKEVMFPNDTSRKIMYQLLCGLKFLHSAGILHRDIKGGNICFDRKSGVVRLTDFGLSRGCESVTAGPPPEEDSEDLDRKEEMMSTVRVCTQWYRSPELLLGDATASAAIDVWSLGCIFAELLYPATGDRDFARKVLFSAPPLPSTNLKRGSLIQLGKIFQVLGTPPAQDLCGRLSWINDAVTEFAGFSKRSLANEFPATTDPVAIDLLEKMLSFDPVQRITVEEALAHPYFASIRTPDLEFTCRRFLFRKDMVRLKYKKRSLSASLLRRFLFDIVKEWNEEKWGFTEEPRFG